MTGEHPYIRGALMARADAADDSENICLALTKEQGILYQIRPERSAATSCLFVREPGAPLWLKLVYRGGVMTRY